MNLSAFSTRSSVPDGSAAIAASRFPSRPLVAALVLPLMAAPLQAQDSGFSPDLASLDLEELLNIRITSVSRRDESLAGAAASIFVITAEDIRRSGATSLPEILRMAPNLQVARVNSFEYAITARGFNNRVGNKLLVLLDGRTLYTPLFSGVFWEMHDAHLEDIERIEVVSGPGGTLWGANAVNGVINIITKNAADTGSTLLRAGAGNFERHASLRTGGSIDERTSWRAWAKAGEWDNTFAPDGSDEVDDWNRQQLGFRMDHNGSAQQLMLQGDVLRGESQHRGFVGTIEVPPVKVAATNLQAGWTRALNNGSDVSLQAYWSYNKRDEFVLFSPTSRIFDFELQHHFTLDSATLSHEVVWGFGYRHARDEVDPGVFSIFVPDRRELEWQNLFVQDEISLNDSLKLVPGIKLEWNDYTGMEQLPSVNLAWQAAEQHLLWAGWSRVVRAPSRFDRDVYYPERAPFIVAGGPDFEAEVAHVLELGYRGQVSGTLSWSGTLFHYDWDKLRSGTPLPLPVYLVNNIQGESWGVEAWGSWQLSPVWHLRAGLSTLHKDLEFAPGTSDTAGIDNNTLHNDPDYQWLLRSSHDLAEHIQLDLQLRRVAALDIEQVPGYAELDLRLGWQPAANVEVALTASNLLHKRHAEYSPLANRSEFGRSILVGIRWMR
jgi:iron complex outermembrane receptor protein